ncbi:MAG: flippase [Lachnospiraceae bacterium]|nr:flippase [Lachnospiraceae bacterium]
MKKRLYENYAYNTIYQLVMLLQPVILTPFLTRVIGAEGIGQYTYTHSVVTYFILLGTMGSNLYAQREIAYVAKDKQKRSRAFWEILLIRCIMLAISLFIYAIAEISLGRYPVLFAVQSIAIVAAGVDITWYFQGQEQFGKIARRNLLVKLIDAVVILLVVKDAEDLWKYALITVVSNLLGQLWLWKDIRKEIAAPKVERLFFPQHLKGMVHLFLPQIATQIYLLLDKTMIEIVTNNSAETGYYELAQLIQRAGVTLITAFGTVTASRIAGLKAEGEEEEIKNVLAKSWEIVSYLGVPVALGIAAVASNLIPWFMGAGYDRVSELLILFGPFILIIGMSHISGIQYMVPMGMQDKLTFSNVAGAVINVVMNSILILKYGAQGAAIASVTTEAVVLVIQYWYIRKVILKSRVCAALLQSLTCGVIMVFVVEAAEKYWFTEARIVNTILLVGMGAVAYLGTNGMLFGIRKALQIRYRKSHALR